MNKETISKLNKSFEESVHEQDGVEFWLARELQELLGYSDWRNFVNAVDKAKESCKNTKETVSDHFVDVNKMVKSAQALKEKRRISYLLDMPATSLRKTVIRRKKKSHLHKATLQFKQGSKNCLKSEFV